MSDIAGWLEAHGLGKFTDAFDRHDVRLDVLHDLDREDLKDLSVSLGDGQRLRKAARSLVDEPAPAAGGPAGRASGGLPTTPTHLEAERRHHFGAAA